MEIREYQKRLLNGETLQTMDVKRFESIMVALQARVDFLAFEAEQYTRLGYKRCDQMFVPQLTQHMVELHAALAMLCSLTGYTYEELASMHHDELHAKDPKRFPKDVES